MEDRWRWIACSLLLCTRLCTMNRPQTPIIQATLPNQSVEPMMKRAEVDSIPLQETRVCISDELTQFASEKERLVKVVDELNTQNVELQKELDTALEQVARKQAEITQSSFSHRLFANRHTEQLAQLEQEHARELLKKQEEVDRLTQEIASHAMRLPIASPQHTPSDQNEEPPEWVEYKCTIRRLSTEVNRLETENRQLLQSIEYYQGQDDHPSSPIFESDYVVYEYSDPPRP